MVAAAEIAVDLVAKHDRLERELGRAANAVDRSLGGMEARSAAFASRFTSLLGGISAAVLVKQLGGLADSAKQIDAQLRLATSSFGTFAKAQDDTRRIADATRGSLEATSALYGSFIRSAQESGRTQADAARATETFGKALKLGGAGAAEASAATLQFNQALASGVLRGDEFNTIAEASPRILRLLAEAMGVPVGQLRKLAEEGKITRDVLYRALTDTRFTDGIDAEFKQLPKTFGDAMQSLSNAALITFGAFDSGGQFSNAMVSFLDTGSTTFKSLESAAQNTGVEIRAAFSGLGNVFDPMLANGTSVLDAIGVKTHSLKEQIASLLGSFDSIANLYSGANNFGTRIENGVKATLNRAQDRAGGKDQTHFQITPLIPRSDRRGAFLRGYDEQQGILQSGIADRKLKDRFPLRFLPNGQLDFRPVSGLPYSNAAAPTPPSGATRKSRGRAAAPKSKLDPDAFSQKQSQLNDELLRYKADTAKTAEEEADFALQRIANDKAQFDKTTAADEGLTGAEKARLTALNGLVAAAEQAAAIRSRDIAVEQRISESLRREGESAEDRNRDQQALVRSRLDIAKTVRARLALELEGLRLAQQEEKAQQERIIADRKRVLADPNATPEARRRAQSDITDAQGRLATQPERFRNEQRVVEQRYQGPLADYRDRIEEATGDINMALETVEANGLRSLEDGLVGVISGTESVGGAFKKMTAGIIADLARVFIQQQLIAPLLNSGGGGGLGKLLGFADGGRIPGYAGGGRITGPGGPRSDSIVARLSAGEYVVNAAAAQRHLPVLDAINSGRMRGYADGGAVQPVAMAMPNLGVSNVRVQPAPASVTVIQNFNPDLRGSITTKEFAERMVGYTDQQVAAGMRQAVDVSRRQVVPTVMKFQQMGTI